ncbi:MAG: ATP-binding protein [Myxococcota bacterium]
MSAEFLAWIACEVGLPLLEGADGLVVRANGAACELLGRDPSGDELTAAAAALTGVPAGDAELAGLVSRVGGAGSTAGAVGPGGRWRLLVHADGGRLWVVAAPARVSQAVRLEQRAAAADVAAGVSHEVANALSAIVGWAQLGREHPGPEAAETFSLIEDSARTARSAARRLLDAVRCHGDQAPEAIDLAPLLEDVVRLLRPEARDHGLSLECRVPGGTWVLGTPSALFTVAWNLLHNAVEALEPGGRIVVSGAAQEGTVRLAVADDGPGMEEEQRLRVFEPYFTTKPTGTGLGLFMVKRAVEELGGRIVLDSARGRGTRFVVELPQARPPAAAADGQAEPRLPRRRSGIHGRRDVEGVRVLLVEDDQTLREMMRTTLALQQARVDAVASGNEADALPGPYDLALVDLSLTDARGDQVVSRLRARGVVTAAALVTGASEPPNLDPGGRPDLWLRKPFEPSDLLETVRLLRTFGGRDAAGTGDPT